MPPGTIDWLEDGDEHVWEGATQLVLILCEKAEGVRCPQQSELCYPRLVNLPVAPCTCPPWSLTGSPGSPLMIPRFCEALLPVC